MRFIPVAFFGGKDEYVNITAPIVLDTTDGVAKDEYTASLFDSQQVSVQFTQSVEPTAYQTIATTINRVTSSDYTATDATLYTGYGFHNDKGLVSPPFFANVNFPASGSDVRLVDFIRETSDTDNCIATYTQPGYKEITEGLGNGTFSVERMVDATKTLTISGTGPSVRNITSGSSDLFEIQSGSYSNILYEMRYKVAQGGGRGDFSDGAFGWFINTDGEIENYNVPFDSGNGTLTIQAQTGRSVAGGNLFQGREQDEIFVRKVKIANVNSKYKTPLPRKYILQRKYTGTYTGAFPKIKHMTVDNGVDEFTFNTGYTLVSASLPPIQSAGNAIGHMWDVTGDEYLSSGSTSGSACSESTQIRYFKSGSNSDAQNTYQGYTGSLAVGITLYQDLGFQNTVESTFFSDGTNWYLTDAQGAVSQSGVCP